MKLLVILALIAVASAIPGCAYFQNAQACFSHASWGQYASAGIPYCKTYGTTPFICATCFPGYTWSATSRVCAKDLAFLDWTLWPTTAADSTQTDSQNCLNWNVQYSLALLQNNYEGVTPYVWDYANMSCVINGQQVCQTCKPGYRWDGTAFKCVACPGAGTCTTCQKVDTKETCLVCNEKKFLVSGACSDCGAGMLTCTAVDKALTCLSGHFKAGDKCTPCESTTTTITCESATVSTKCKNGYFLDATTKKCTACGQDNIGTCTATLAAGIENCQADASGANTIYKLTDECKAHDTTNMCATIGKTAGGVYHCATCFEGYINTGGKCVTKEDFCLHSVDGLTVDAACGTLTSQSGTTPHPTLTCKDKYYLELRTTGQNKCRKCSATGSGAPNCEASSSCVGSGTTNPPKCTTAAAAGYYLIAAAPEITKACDPFFGIGCKTCTLAAGCTAVTDTSTHFLCYRIINLNNSDLSKKTSCSKVYADNAPTNPNYSFDGTNPTVDLTVNVANCKTFELDTGELTQYNCTECTRTEGGDLYVAVTKVTAAGGTVRAAEKQVCKKGGAGNEAPVDQLQWKHCLQASTNTLIANTATKCQKCDKSKSVTVADGAGCTETTAITGCAILVSDSECDTCVLTTHIKNGGKKCAAIVANCKTHVPPATGVLQAVCQTCTDTYRMKADGTACYRCDNITNALKCTEFVINKADAGCGCSKCVAGYYVNSVDAENYCVNTNATEKNCYQLSTSMTGTWACAVCNYGFKVVAGVCTSCVTAGTNCVYTGCAGKDYINKTPIPAAPATSYSSIISFLIMTLVALMTFMI